MTSLGDKFETLEEAFQFIYVCLREINPASLNEGEKMDLNDALAVAEVFTNVLNDCETWTRAKEVLKEVNE